MEFLVLGPLEVRRDGQTLDVRGSKRRSLLALLVLHANEVVRTDRLVDELWGGRPPANAHAALHNHVSRLRKDLGDDVLATKPWGYVLRAEEGEIDLLRFEAAVAEARTLPAGRRRAKLSEALALWRGPAFADVSGEDALAAESARLDELRLSALEQRIDADLELGGEPALILELERLVAEHPLRERLRGQLILALYRDGRQAEALETFRETRRVLVDELGIEPSAELRELERAILRQDPALTPAPAAAETLPAPGFRWPRSPLAIGAAFLVLASAGAAAALVLAGGEPDAGEAAPPPERPSSPKAAPPVAEPPTTTAAPAPKQRSRAIVHRVRRKPATTASTVTVVRQQPRKLPKPAAGRKPIATTTAATTTDRAPAAKEWVYLLEDDFDDPAFDAGMWHFATNPDNVGVTAAEHDGRVEFSVDADALRGRQFFDGHYGTQCTISGDFDAWIEYELVDWPVGDGLLVFFAPWFQGASTWTFIGRKGQPSDRSQPDRYATNVYGYVPPEVPAADSRGALRAVRAGKYITTYYRARGQWVRMGRAYAPGVVRLLFGVSSSASEFGSQPAVVAFDNFHATAPDEQYSVECQGVPYPPRRPRR